MKSVVITGVSSGIGYDAVSTLLSRNYHVFGSVREVADAVRLQDEFGPQFTPLLFDVTDERAVVASVDQVAPLVGEHGLTALVNNAGITVTGPLMHVDLDAIRYQLEVNVIGVLAVTRAFLPLLGGYQHCSHAPGRIVNISSISGRLAYPFLGPYAASKHALEALSDSLRRELLLYGIDVIVIEPGTTATPIREKGGQQFAKYADTDYAVYLRPLEGALEERRKTAIPVRKVSETIARAIEDPKPKSRYVVPRKRLSGWLVPRLLPDRWLDRLLARRLRSTRPT